MRASILFLLTGIVTVPAISDAQTVSSGTNVYIGDGLTVSVDGSFSTSGFIQHKGTLSLTGDWNNTGVYQGAGLISLDGGDQLVQNKSQTVEHLVVNGGGKKTISGKVVIGASVALNAGNVFVGNADTLLLEAGCEVKGGSPSSHVEGALTTRGTGYKFYPIGINGSYHPAELTDVQGTDPVMSMKVATGLPTIAVPARSSMAEDFYWVRETVSGSFERSPVTLGYKIADSVSTSRVVIATSNSVMDNFKFYDELTKRSPSSSLDIYETSQYITGNIYAIGQLLADPPRKYYFSTTLSPDAVNPENRTVRIFGDNITSTNFYFQVFNRWGLTLFESTSYSDMATNGWDGRHGSSVLASGAYPFSLRFVDQNGKATQHTGFITIIH